MGKIALRMCGGQRTAWKELVLFFYHVVSGDRTPVLRFNCKCLYQPRYLSSLVDPFLDPGRPPRIWWKREWGAQVALPPSIGELLRINVFGKRLRTLVLNSVPS